MSHGHLHDCRKMKNIENTTTGLMENLLQSLDVEAFVKGVQAFDNVTQRQCFLKALKEIRKSNVIGLYGQERVKNAGKRIRDVLDVEAQMS
jgi:hypothetical protein